MNKNRRSQYVINKPFQYKMIIYLCLLVIGVILIAHGLALGFSEIMSSRSESALQSSYFQFRISALLEAMWLPVLSSLILGVIFVLVFGLVYSHRIAGPLFNLKNAMTGVELGDLSITMHIRSTDELHDIEKAFNKMVDGLNDRLTRVKTVVNELPPEHKKKMDKVIKEQFSMRYFID